MKMIMILLFGLMTLQSCQGQQKQKSNPEPAQDGSAQTPAVLKTDAEWKKILTPQQYEVLRKKGTERPHTGEYVNTFKPGTYVCAACGNLLFESDAKFASDCGWPSFDKVIPGSVVYHDDSSFGMTRIEVTCASCGGHLGHVFDDGPQETTGKRYCTNSVSIKFISATNKK
jgi:peptide-methionine (R)-S-oxide reductase